MDGSPTPCLKLLEATGEFSQLSPLSLSLTAGLQLSLCSL